MRREEKKTRETAEQTEKSTDESLSPETQLLTIKDGGIKKRWRENENSGMRGRWRRDGERDWEEIGHEEDEKSVNRKLESLQLH